MTLNRLVAHLALAGLAAHTAHALAEDTKLQRVEVTGSSIKRLQDEGALPLDVITADQIRQQGLSSAEDLLRSLSVNAANANNAVSSNSVFGQEGDRLAGGGAYANLRGLGPNGTLVLLNGRRLSNQGTSGGAVDLNAIPIDMIDRVEVLKDGASAIYGTDAIGGVINFILKRDYQGAKISASYSTPTASGGGQQRKLNLTAGWGDIAKDRFNVVGSITHGSNTILRGVDRPWAAGYQPGIGLAPDTSSSPFFANIIGQANSAMATSGTTIGATDTTKYTVINALALSKQCDAVPFGVSQAANPTLLAGFGYTVANSTYRCGTDYGRQFMLMAPSTTTSGVARANFAIDNDTTAFVEFVGSRYYSRGEFTPYQFSTTSLPFNANVGGTVFPTGADYPVNGPYYVNMKTLYGANNFDPTKPIAYRLRMWDWGYRTLGNESTNDRLTAGIEGSFGRYDYRASIARGKASGYQEMIDGYADGIKLVKLLASGIYNPFRMPGQAQTADAMAAVEGTKVHGRLASGSTQVDQLLASISGPIMPLAGGDLAFALGTDLRRESYGYSGTQTYTCISTFTVANLNNPNPVMGCPGNASAPDQTRNVSAVYGEILAPVLKNLELNAALRYDRYTQVGGTTNPKLGFKFTPTPELLMRGSYNTGFRAPTPQQLNLGTVQLATTGSFADPVKCPVPAGNNDPSCQLNSIPYLSGGNPNLKPEKSRQASLGVVIAPAKGVQASFDFWQIKMIDRIHNLTPTQELANYSVFANNFQRDASGNITLIQAGWINAGGSMTRGLDIVGNWTLPLEGAMLNNTLSATKMISAREQLIDGTPMVQYVGQWTNTTLYLPWKVNVGSTYKAPNWSATASLSYSSRYMDEDHTTLTTLPGMQTHKISAYTTINLVGSYTGIKDLGVSVGVLNVMNRKPPFTWHDVDNAVGTGWDPRVVDPRGRTVQVTANYKFW